MIFLCLARCLRSKSNPRLLRNYYRRIPDSVLRLTIPRVRLFLWISWPPLTGLRLSAKTVGEGVT